MTGVSEYPDRILAEVDGEPVVLAARVTETESLTGVRGTTIRFAPENPPLPSGTAFTIVTSTETDS